ncbi:cytochrome P450 [Polyporus arcularius HHB13444]|uniref:Cytochrome P450 n=1 Tax=Polyporus arcularius HHB13444 TaxID=1314778 RepID=A0A5C3PY98_9APHY|nr:cytochrome P450 [Polyporus arcularius HHB13444]
MLPATASPSAVTLCLFILLAKVAWWLYKRLFARSPLDSVPGPRPTGNWILGHFKDLFHRESWRFQHDLYNNYGQVVATDGLLGRKWLFVFDPLALHHVLLKDQHVYEETEQLIQMDLLLFGPGLLSVLGETHRKQRKMLNPVFSVNHMRHMLPLFYEVTDWLKEAIQRRIANGPRTLDMLSWSTRVALELIGQGGLGYSFDPLTADSANPYGDAMKNLMPAMLPLMKYRIVLPLLCKYTSPCFRRWVLERIPWEPLQKIRRIIDTMDDMSREIYNAKMAALRAGEEAVVQQVSEGKDILNKLLQANMTASDADKLPDDQLIAQITTIVFAAMDTTSGVLAHILHMLAEHPDVQEELRREIISAIRANDGERPTYDQLSELTLLDCVCRETLRMFPPLVFLARTAVKDAVLPLSTPIHGRDGTLMHEVAVPKGTSVVISILASNRNRAIWGSDADEWKPDRWLKLPEAVTEAHIPGVYSHLLTFLGGSRACIGFKFSEMEMKVVLTTLLQHFKFSVPEDLKEPIFWNFGGVQWPSVGRTSDVSELPLKVELVRA